VTQAASVRVTVVVDVDQAAAFKVFTDEIDAWYRRGPHNFFDPVRAIAIRFEPREGGRLLEVYDNDSGDAREMGRITVWEPPARLIMRDVKGTEIDVAFEPHGDKTKVTLEHRGLERLTPDDAATTARYGGRLLIGWYSDFLRERTRS
jgi:hypothetical protein